jgi:hypothetical protein
MYVCAGKNCLVIYSIMKLEVEGLIPNLGTNEFTQLKIKTYISVELHIKLDI